MQGEGEQESEGEDLPEEEELPEEEFPEEEGEFQGEEAYPQGHGAAAASSSSGAAAPAEDGGAQDAGPGKAFEEGDYVQVFGLESAGGKQLNSRCGTIAKYVEAHGKAKEL